MVFDHSTGNSQTLRSELEHHATSQGIQDSCRLGPRSVGLGIALWVLVHQQPQKTIKRSNRTTQAAEAWVPFLEAEAGLCGDRMDMRSLFCSAVQAAAFPYVL